MADYQEFEGKVAQTNDGGFKLEGGGAWINYSTVGDGYTGPTFNKGQLAFVQCVESKGRWYASYGRLANGSAPAGPAPAPSPSPQPQSYQEYQEAAGPGPAPRGYEEHPETAAYVDTRGDNGGPEPGTFAYRDLVNEVRTRASIERQKALQCAVDTLRMRSGENVPPWESDEKLKAAVLDVAGEYLRWLQPDAEPVPEVESEHVEPSP